MYQMADLMLVTPVRDGMNLVAKEYIACRSNDDSALVLSEFAGAARELKQAYMVNPYDIDGMKATIMKALTDSPRSKPARCVPCVVKSSTRRSMSGQTTSSPS